MNCIKIRPLLSEFIDNTLSARSTWEVDRHLADCNACAQVLNELRRTVVLVTGAPRYEVSADFMEGLTEKLAGIEPASPRGAWLESMRQLFRPRVLPAWGAALGACALALLVLVPRPGPPGIGAPPSSQSDRSTVRRAAQQNVALSANDPLADLGAANVTAHASGDAGLEAESAN